MTSICRKSALMWSLLGLILLMFALMFGPAPALANQPGADAVLYEVTEDMYLVVVEAGKVVKHVTNPAEATHRQAVAQLSGFAKLGTPLCPEWVLWIVPKAKQCALNATGADLLALGGPEAGKGTVEGTFTVVVQDTNTTDGPEFVIMTGSFAGDADLSLALAGMAPLGFIAKGAGTVDGYGGTAFTFSGTFRLPFSLDAVGRHGKPRRDHDAFYLSDEGRRLKVKDNERSLGVPTVRLEITF